VSGGPGPGRPSTGRLGPGYRRTKRARPTPAAVLVERLAVLVGAGVAPARAWGHVGAVEPPGPVRRLAEAVALDGGDGVAVSTSLVSWLDTRPFEGAVDSDGHDRTWRQVACAWRVAETSGAPMADCLHSLVSALRAADEARRDVQVALSGPRATANVVLALPPVGLLFSAGLGFDTGAVLVGTPIGWACVVVAGCLVVVARRWNARLVRGAHPSSRVPGLRPELLAVALSGGSSWSSGLAAVDEAVAWCGVEAVASEPRGGAGSADETADRIERRRCEAVLDLSRRAGAPAGLLLRSEARELRLEARTAAPAAAGRLGVTLMLPLGVCILPAFLVVGVVPLVVSLVSSTAGSW
jgi:tight adherence protein B